LGKCILIIGGARSGKSRLAMELARNSGKPVLFVATATAGDDEMAQRIAMHRKERPAGWSTIEVTTDVGKHIKENIGGARLVIVDCITLLVNNIFNKCGYEATPQAEALLEERVASEINSLVECVQNVAASFIVVTNEIGLGLVPVEKTSRLYRDLLGKANQMLAKCADEVYLMVAGMPVKVTPSTPDL
jgi:adenosylcobinamide kinase/adenosylcobinamide-phosphate guanylyltransferase